MEASGTSGQKIAVHGGLNLSILDGWWPEGYDGQNGWAIGSGSDTGLSSPEEQDQIDATNLYRVLGDEVIPAFYDRDEMDIPREWTSRMRNAMVGLPAQFSAARMVRDYVELVYERSSQE